MLLSAVWILILTAPIHYKGSFFKQTFIFLVTYSLKWIEAHMKVKNNYTKPLHNIFTFTFMHLADAFIRLTVHSGYTFFNQYVFSGNRTHDALLYH